MIDAAAAYDTELTEIGRTPVYQVRITPVSTDPNPAAYWKMDQTSGSRPDSVGIKHLSDHNGVTSAVGKLSNAAQFNGTTQYLDTAVTNGSALQIGDISFTMAAWVYLDATASDRTIMAQSKGTGINPASFNLRYRAGGVDRFQFVIIDDVLTSATVEANALGAPSLNTWYFIVAWRDKAALTINIQVNDGGVNSTSTGLIPSASITNLTVGATATPNDYFSGRIDEVSFWRTTLTTSKRSFLYNGGVARAYEDLAAIRPVYNFCTSRPITNEDLGNEILDVKELVRRAEIDRGRFSLSTLIFELQDINNAATPIVAIGLEGARCEFFAGFYDAWFPVQLFGGLITEVDYISGRYKVTARSPLVAGQEKVIFKGAQTRLSAALTSSDTGVSVVDATYFDIASSTPQSSRRTFLVDNEIIVYRGKTPTSFSSCIRVGAFPFFVPPGFPDTVSVAHSAGAPVREMVGMMSLTVDNDEVAGTINDQHPIDYLQTILTNTDLKHGIGLSLDDVNTEELAAVRTALGSTLRFRFLESDGSNGKKFLEEQIYLPLAAYPTEDERGRIGIKLFQTAASVTSVGAVKDDDIVDFPHWVRNAERLINTVIYHYDYNPLTNQYTSTYKYQDAALLALHGRELPLEIFSRGIRSPFSFGAQSWFLATPAFLTAAAQRHIARFGNKSPVIQAQTILAKELMEIGDDIKATFSNVVNLTAASRQITDAPFEIASMRFDFRSNLIDMELLGYPQ